jgi:MoxR-like ATPase
VIHPNRFAPDDDPTDGHYLYGPELIRAIKVALATGRPLLLRGAPGTGKTTMARDFARILRSEDGTRTTGADYYQEVVTSRTEARDFEWKFDAVLRLADTQLDVTRERVARAANYVEPRALWWAFDPESARRRGGGADTEAPDPLATSGGSQKERPAVVLIDEIDKAEPEVANDLLEPFDVQRFRVAETGVEVSRKRDVFLVVTTNDERDLPAAFLRRCVVHELTRPDRAVLARIARSHFGTAEDDPGVDRMITRLEAIAKEAYDQRLREPAIAEFLDALRAIEILGPAESPELALQPAAGSEWDAITRLAMWKHPARKERA